MNRPQVMQKALEGLQLLYNKTPINVTDKTGAAGLAHEFSMWEDPKVAETTNEVELILINVHTVTRWRSAQWIGERVAKRQKYRYFAFVFYHYDFPVNYVELTRDQWRTITRMKAENRIGALHGPGYQKIQIPRTWFK